MAKTAVGGKARREISVHRGYRFPLSLLRKIQRAAKRLGEDESQFVRRAAEERQERVLAETVAA